MNDRTTKALLFAIAIALWLNLVGAWLRPTPVSATPVSAQIGEPSTAQVLTSIERHTREIAINTSAMSVSLKFLANDAALRKR
jgi:hypothetical protein